LPSHLHSLVNVLSKMPVRSAVTSSITGGRDAPNEPPASKNGNLLGKLSATRQLP